MGRRTRVLRKRDYELSLPVGAHVLEYKVRWLGFAQNYDRWRAVQYLDGIAELVKEYNQHNPFAPDDMPSTFEVISRPELSQPGPTDMLHSVDGRASSRRAGCCIVDERTVGHSTHAKILHVHRAASLPQSAPSDGDRKRGNGEATVSTRVLCDLRAHTHPSDVSVSEHEADER